MTNVDECIVPAKMFLMNELSIKEHQHYMQQYGSGISCWSR